MTLRGWCRMKYEMVKLSNVGKIITGNTPSKKNSGYYDDGNIPFIKPNNFIRDSISNLFESDEYLSISGSEAARMVNEGTVLVTCIGTIGNVGIASKKICFNQQINAIEPDNTKINSRYLAYTILKYKKQLKAIANAPVVPIINKTQFSLFEIPLPPLETQEKIVEVLDKAQALIDARKEQIRLMDELIQAQFIEMFGDPVTNPKGWKIKKLVEIGSLERGKSKHRPRNAPELLCGKYPLVQTGDIANAGLYIHNYSQTYSELGLQQSKMWNKGTLCITIAANIAKTSILGFDSCFPDSIVAFIPNSNVESMYVQIWFRFLQKIIENNAPESAQKNINLKILRDLDIPLPDIYIQKKFCKVIDMIEVERKRLNTSLTELENIYNSIMKKSFGNIL